MKKHIFLALFCLLGFLNTGIAQTINSATPNKANQKQTLSVTISGNKTGFGTGTSTTQIWFSQGTSTAIYASSVTVLKKDTAVTANFTIPGNAPTGLYNVNAYNSSKGSMKLTNGFTVNKAPTVVITSVKPNTGTQGKTLNVTISGQNTNFNSGSNTVWFSQGTSTAMYPATSMIISNDTIIANLAIPVNAKTGLYDVNVQNYLDGKIVKTGGFTVNSKPSAKIIKATPDSARQGQSLKVSISCTGTYFTQGTNTVQVMVYNGTSVPVLKTLTASEILDDSTLIPGFNIPSSTKTGWYTLKVKDNNTGLITKANGFYIDSVTPPIKVYGKLTTSTGASLKNSKVYLLSFNPKDTTYTVVNTVNSDASGNYNMITTATIAYLAVEPDSANYPNEMPTYYKDTFLFQGAIKLSLHPGANQYDFSSLYGRNLGGLGLIKGNVYSCIGCKSPKDGNPRAGVKIILVDNKGKARGWGYTATDGSIEFKNISLESYRIFADVPGLDNTKAPLVIVSSAKPKADSLDFTIYPDRLELNVTTGIVNPDIMGENVKVFPNPFGSKVVVELNLTRESNVSMSMMDITGRELGQIFSGIAPSGSLRIPVNASSLKPGIYLLKMTEGDRTSFIRLIKTE